MFCLSFLPVFTISPDVDDSSVLLSTNSNVDSPLESSVIVD